MKKELQICCLSVILLRILGKGAEGVSFSTCNANSALGSDIMDVFRARSSFECSVICTNRQDCLATNVCNAGGGQVTCELLGARVAVCGLLNSRAGCIYWEREILNYGQCLNGGKPSHSPPCLCEPGWAGDYCQRIVRDCSEGTKSGQTGWTMSDIQPIGCPYSFMTYCVFEWGNTYILRRGYQHNPSSCSGNTLEPNMDWNGYKKPFGVIECDLFLGLENIWYILRQGSYNLEFYMQYHDVNDDLKTVTVYYWNFKMASEADDYAIKYSSFTANNGAEDGLLLGANTPTRFCTHDRDCGMCARDKGVAWWYTPNCDNYPLTVSNGYLKWPINGVAQQLSLAILQIAPNYYY